MRKWRAFVASGLLASLAVARLDAQTAPTPDHPFPTPTSPWTGPRLPDGQPDVRGQWNKSWPGSNGANFDLEEGIDQLEITLTGRDPKNFPRPRVVQTPDGRIPYQPWARALREEIRRYVFDPTKVVHVDSNARCLQMGIPRQDAALPPDRTERPAAGVRLLRVQGRLPAALTAALLFGSGPV